MLYKPTSASPHNDIVNPNLAVEFTCESMSNSLVNRARLSINDSTYEYFFDSQDDVSVITDTYATKIQYNFNPPQTANYKINNTNYVRVNQPQNALTLTNGNMFTWKMRLYEDDSMVSYTPTSWIGWGTVAKVSSLYTNDDYSEYRSNESNRTGKLVTLLEITPHTNMPFNRALGGCTMYNGYRINNLCTYYDDNAKYYIKLNGKIHEILDYKFYNPLETSLTDEYLEKILDPYGTPISGYAVISYLPDVITETEYNIYCNFIDTDTYYFDVNTPPTVSLYEHFDNNGTPIQREITDNALLLNYSNLCIRGNYLQAEGATVNRYSIILEEYLNHRYTIVDSTGDIHSPFIEYKFDRFLNNKEYRLTFSLTDTFGVTTEKVIDIKVKYQGNSFPLNVKVEEYKEHNSLIVDFSELKSITAQEAMPNRHQFLAYDEETGQLDKLLYYTNNACHVDIGNSITYDHVDGEGNLAFGDSTYYLICNIDSGYEGHIFEAQDDDKKTITLDWDGLYLKARFQHIRYNNQILTFNYQWSPYEQWFKNNVAIDEQKEAMIDMLQNGDQKVYNIPTLYFEDLPYDETYYYHEETALSDQTWAVILGMSKNLTTGYILCKNLTTDDDWTGVGI